MKAKRTGDPVPIASRRRAEHLGVADLRELEIEATVYLEADPRRAGAEHLRGVVKAARLALAALDQGEAAGAVVMAMQTLQCAWMAEIAEGRPLIDRGVKSARGGVKGNMTKAKAAESVRELWQQKADALWRVNASMSALAVAERIDAGRADYIRKHIVKPRKSDKR